MQTRSESSPNLGRWFFKCPDGHKNRFFWADEWRRPAHPGPAGHQQHAAPQHGGLPQPPPPPQHGYDTHGSPRFGTAASQQDVPFHAGQPGHQQPLPYPQTPQQPRPAPPQMQSPPAAAGQAGGGPYATPQAPTGVGGGMLVQVQVLEIAPGDLGLKTPVYHEPFRDVIMQLPWPESGRHWDKGVGVWRIRSGCYLEARDLLTRNGYRVQDAPPRVLDILVKRTSAWSPRTTYKQAEEWVLPKVDPELWGRLFAYQREGVLAGVRFGGRVLYADEMGLGKTVQALTLMSCYTEDWPLLIICPTSLRFAWVAAVQQWLPPHLQPAPADLWQVGAVTDWDRLAAAAGIEPGSDHEEYPRGGGRAGGGGRLRPHIAVVSYDLATKIAPQHASRYRAIICDECHALKNRTTQRAQKIGPLVRAADRAVLCTGTAILNRPIELFTQVDMLKPGLLGSYTEYGDRYCVNTANTFYQQQQQQHQTPNSPGAGGRGSSGGRGYGGGRGGGYSPAGGFPGQEYTGANALGELKAVLGECVMVRRRKDEVLGDLPPKIRSKVPLQPCEDDLRRVAADLRELKRVLAAAAAGHMSGHEALSARQQAWSAAYRATGPAKLTEAKAFLTRLLERDADDATATQAAAAAAAAGGGGGGAAGGGGGDEAGGGGGVSGPCKVLVFAHHQEVLNGLQEHLKQLKVMHMRIDGSTPAHERDKAVAAFQRLGPRTPRVALLSLHAAGTGLTLTAATVVVFVELDQSPSLLVQAEDRAHRVGQAAHVHVYYLMAKGTLDEQIWAMLERKRFVCGAALDGPGPAAAVAAAPAGAAAAAYDTAPVGTTGGAGSSGGAGGAGGGGFGAAEGGGGAVGVEGEVDLDLEGLDEQLFESASQPQEQLWGGSAGAGSGAGAGGGGSAGSGSQLYGYGVPRSAGSGYGTPAGVVAGGAAAAGGTQAGGTQGAGGGSSGGAGGRGVAAAGGSHSDAVVAMRRNLFWDSDEDGDNGGGGGGGGGRGTPTVQRGGGSGGGGIHTPPTQPPPADGHYGSGWAGSGGGGGGGGYGSGSGPGDSTGRPGSQLGSGLGGSGRAGSAGAAAVAAAAAAAAGQAAAAAGGDVEMVGDVELVGAGGGSGGGGGGGRGGTQNSSSHVHSHPADTHTRANAAASWGGREASGGGRGGSWEQGTVGVGGGGGSELRRRERRETPPYPQTQVLAGQQQVQQQQQPGSQPQGGSSGSGRRGGGGGGGSASVVVDLTQADDDDGGGSGGGGQQAAKRRKAEKVEIVID
ncbi:hypothetical protein CHLRE_05g236950v5 [Chlamydomonas reinhardtii]|uniref:Uncharacterized protein n=1 Tax=Chlamydomonas reinhardtii TaxID=3055 RepID=A0A2K3DSU7_CHLRE|nr:uncharacterized protein CHLRE_05g236950v5 [Chlamydomonas reinhardtii]PNW83616.1 hypothetical protein CHLRE_05g236950v5 [Chlamydomonas reinhardtii]